MHHAYASVRSRGVINTIMAPLGRSPASQATPPAAPPASPDAATRARWLALAALAALFVAMRVPATADGERSWEELFEFHVVDSLCAGHGFSQSDGAELTARPPLLIAAAAALSCGDAPARARARALAPALLQLGALLGTHACGAARLGCFLFHWCSVRPLYSCAASTPHQS